jgi:hypothetical protein
MKAPPSTSIVYPVINDAASLTKNKLRFAMSSFLPNLYRGVLLTIFPTSDSALLSDGLNLSNPSVPSIAPGEIPLTLIPNNIIYKQKLKPIFKLKYCTLWT